MREFPNDTLSKNLLALSGFNLHEATSIGDTHPSDSLLFNTAKSGQLVPVIQSSGRPRPLHSQFDPLREASRLASQVSTGGFVIVLGFGGGYHIRELLQNQAVESILIVDFEYPCMRSILSHIDVSDIFVDSRVRFFIDPSVEDIRNYLLERYIPALMGDIRSLELRSRTLMLPELFNSILEVLTQTIRTVSEDYSVQARFGRRWMSNTMANLAISDRHSITIPPRRKVMIAAAGPSLDQNLALIKSTAAEYYCIATDTSLPWLLKHNILPDIVLSIDCQLVTYHHFFTELPDSIPVLFDLASPPTLTRRIRNTLFFSSGHPFSQYVGAHLNRFPTIDTSGGNVTHAAVSLAHSLGAASIKIFGADYGYPNGKTYARDTYLFSYYRSKESRLHSSESKLADFVFESTKLKRYQLQKEIMYTTPTLEGYRNRIVQLAGEIPAAISSESRYGPQFNAPSKAPPQEITLLNWRAGLYDWKDFLQDYGERLTQLEIPQGDLTRFFTNQSRESLELWLTIFPTASHFRYLADSSEGGGSLLRRTRDWTVREVQKTLAANRSM